MLEEELGSRSLTGPHSSLHCCSELSWKVEIGRATSIDTEQPVVQSTVRTGHGFSSHICFVF